MEINGGEERQRVERWIEDSQYVIGRLIPGVVEDRERLRLRAEASEQECDRLREEINELRKSINDLHSERQYLRDEQMTMAETVGSIMGQMNHILKPLSDLARRLQSGQAPLAENAA